MATIFREPLVTTKPADRRDLYPPSLRTLTTATTVLTLLLAAVPPPTVHAQETSLAPIGKHYPSELRTWIVNLQQTTLFVAPQTPPIGRAADPVPPSAPYPVHLRTTLVDLLSSTLYVAPAPSQAPLAEPPSAAPYPLDLRSWGRGPSLAQTVTPSVIPTGTSATPPAVGPGYPIDLRTTITTSLTQIPFAAGNYQSRIPNVAPQWTAPYPIDLRTTTLNLLQGTLRPVVVPPFTQYDWPAQSLPVYPVSLRTAVTFFVQDLNTPPQPGDTSTPRTSVYPLDLRTETVNVLPILFSAKPTAAQYDWPTIPGAPYPTDLRTITQALVTRTLFVPPATPIGATQTATTPPPPYGIDLRTTLINLRQTTLAPIPPPAPFAQYDWPVPPSAFYPLDNRTSLHATDLRLKDTFFTGPGGPLRNYDWPTIPGPIYPISCRTWTQSPGQVGIPLWMSARINVLIGPSPAEPE